ncbi:uncharacterized protein [Eurosta solidaginis]|uniref:uncharacterized protein n=1 Tax=Eurosta solidaginis TaxID=178769 RepID=UPI003530A674
MTRLTKLEVQNALQKVGIEYPATATVSQLRALLEEDDSDSGVAAAAAVGGEYHDGDGNVGETDDAENLDEQIAVLEKRKKMLLLQKELQASELDATSARQRITVMDIDGMVPKFSGDNAYPVEKWINDFENAVKVGHKDDHFKYMCMHRLLSGTAAIFLRTSIASNYCELKAALVKQFHRNVSTNDVYQELYPRRRSPNESIIAYMLSIKEIAAQANLNEDEIINAVIEGLRDNTAYTSILYTAKNLDELQQLLLKYDKKKTNDNTTKKLQISEGGSKTVSSKRCFNCSQYGYTSHFSAKNQSVLKASASAAAAKITCLISASSHQ